MSRYFLMICIVIQCSLTLGTLHAQETKYQISGVIVDSLTQKPGEYFTVAIKKDSLVIKSVVSDAQGKFSFSGIGEGQYRLLIGSLGYRPKQLVVKVTANTDLGKISMTPAASNELGEVSVAGSRPLIKQEPDRIVYDIQADAESKVLSVLDMMRKVPLLSVDADDNVKLKGTGNYRILINGKPSGILTRDPKEYLKSMPAAGVQKIEVITTPPSKYESEGLSGIINIITSKKMENGYNGNLNARYQFPGGPSGNGNFTIKQGKFGANLYGGTGVWQVDGIKLNEIRNSRETPIPSSLYSLGFQKIDNKWAWGGGELSYEIDSLNLITVEVNPYSGYNQQNLMQHFDLRDGAVSSAYDMSSANRYEWGGTDYTFNYQKGFRDKKEHLLTFSYKFFNSSEPQLSDVMFSNKINFTGPDYKQENTSSSKEQTIQVDYVNPFKKLTVEAGVKAILRNGESNFQYLNFNPAQNIYQVDPSQGNVYGNDQNIFGVYNTYILKLKNWTFKAGARLEGTYVTGNFESTNTTVKTDYFNLIPSVSFNRTLKNSQSISLGFTQRIQRPGIWDLNPFVDKSRPNFEYFGNPDLEATLSNNFELTYSNFKKGSLNLSLSYNFANNTQQQVYEYLPAQNLTRITSFNIGKSRLLGTNANFNYPITAKWNVNLSANLNYIWLEGMINGVLAKNSGLTGYSSFTTSYKFEKTWKTSVSFNYGAPDVMLQGQSNYYYYLGFSGSKDIIKDKLTFSAMVANPFQKYRAYRSYTEGVNFTQERIRENPFRRISFGLNWKFGKLKGSIKKSERSISNDDTKKSSN
ncbi:outer membrane beta-barrel protein [Pedobacter sp. 22226]|uniref:outer membrane beta-barrel protein n=1 Tax=Pedobacter sp. 22226 TaxID=3453894 RepID=UPI003F87454F